MTFLDSGFCPQSFLTSTCTHSHLLPSTWTACQCSQHAVKVSAMDDLWSGVSPAQFLQEQAAGEPREDNEQQPYNGGSSSESDSGSEMRGFVSEDESSDSGADDDATSLDDSSSYSASEDGLEEEQEEQELASMNAMVRGLVYERNALMAIINSTDPCRGSSAGGGSNSDSFGGSSVDKNISSSSSSSSSSSRNSSSSSSGSGSRSGSSAGGGDSETYPCAAADDGDYAEFISLAEPVQMSMEDFKAMSLAASSGRRSLSRTVSEDSLRDFHSLRDSLQLEMSQGAGFGALSNGKCQVREGGGITPEAALCGGGGSPVPSVSRKRLCAVVDEGLPLGRTMRSKPSGEGAAIELL